MMTDANPDTLRLQQLNRMYRTISSCHHHLVRAEDEQTLAQRFCSVMVEEGGYRMAWVGYGEHDPAQTIRPIAYAGLERGYLETLHLTWADTERGSGPGARCIREQTVQVTQDIVHDPRFAIWRDEAAKRGYVSSIALPLRIGTGTVGFLGMYSDRSDAFDEEEVGLLTEAADDLALGITAMRNRQERTQLADALEEAARFNRAILDGLSSQIAILDEDGVLVAVNKPWEAFAAGNGLPPGSASVGGDYLALLDGGAGPHAESGRPIAEGIRRVLRGAIPDFELEYPAHGSSGQRWFSVRVSPFPGQDRHRAIVVHEDITERKRSEEAVLQSEHKLRMFIEYAPAALAMFDDQMRYLAVSRRWMQDFGLTPEEAVVGRSQFEVLPNQPEHWALAVQAALQGDVVQVEEDRFVAANGSEHWLRWEVRPWYQGEGVIGGIVILSEDITERRQATDTARERQELVQLLLDSTAEGIYGIDLYGNCMLANPTSARLLGYADAEELKGRKMHALIHHHHRDGRPYPEEECPVTRTLQTREGTQVLDEVLWRADGTRFDAEYFAYPMWRGEEFVGAVVTFVDVSQHRNLEEQFRQAQKMEAIGQLAGGVAHDFNNLLTIINGYSEMLLQSTPQGDPNRELLEEISKAGARSASLTRQLLAFSRQQVLAPKVLDLNDVVRETERMLRRVIGEDIELTAALQPRLGSVKADPGQLEQVLLNLAVNARDAMPQGGKLTIETHNVVLDEDYARSHADAQPGPHVMLAVTDTGIGMTEEVKRHGFEPFFTTKETGKGTGLGLAVIHGIVKQSDGSIEVYSEPGLGTSFKIYFPRVDQAASTISAWPAHGPAPRGTETLLLVEDEDAVRALARITLQQYGYTVLEASHSEEAIRIATNHHETIHVLVTDVVMPGMGGRILAERLQGVHPEMKVLYISGYTGDAVVRHGILHEDVDFLQKPFSPITLAHRIREVLAK